MKAKTHDLNHELTFSAHTINCVCHSISSMFRYLGIYNFAKISSWHFDLKMMVKSGLESFILKFTKIQITPCYCLQLCGIHFLFTVTISCGGQASENCTYFESSGTESGACRAKVCKCSSDICQVFFIKNPPQNRVSI